MKTEYYDFLVTVVGEYQDREQETFKVVVIATDEQMAIAEGVRRLSRKSANDPWFVVSVACKNRGYYGYWHEDGYVCCDEENSGVVV